MNSPKSIHIENYDYPLPQHRIAQHPLSERDACKLLVYRDGNIEQRIFRELPELLPAGSTLVYNNTRVINARLRFRKDTGATIEIFCLEPASPADYAQNFAQTSECSWTCFVGNSKRWKGGALTSEITVGDNSVTLSAERVAQDGNAWQVKFSWNGDVTFAEVIAAAGQIPIPPYLNRDTEDADLKDYQTVYSHIDGSVAAPTAGLHFTDQVLERISDRGIERKEVTLHVGAGTFQPVKSDTIGEHPMHSEFIAVDLAVVESLAQAVERGPVIAVGTTSVRTVESLYHIGCLISQGKWEGEVPQWYPYADDAPNLTAAQALMQVVEYLKKNNMSSIVGDTRIIIAPGYKYRVISGMVTNFHQPRSTLLLLVSAFVGEDKWRGIYDFALDNDFRFLSYGDACLLM